jgi:glutathione-regulated potassium-efflux system ancillary protein KefC
MLIDALIYLAAAVLAVPVAKRLGLGSVLGYLLAGIAIGPHALSLVGDQTSVLHFSEFGVVMMLFLIGLELRPGLLWQLRRPILGLGGLQVLLTTVVVGIALVFVGLAWQTAAALALTLSLSSTAIALQSLDKKGLLKTQAGNNAFSVLLFQDIAVIPILALFPLLALGEGTAAASDHGGVLEGLPLWLELSLIFGSMLAIVFGGRFLAAPLFRFVADTRLREIFTALALLIVVAMAALMQMLGLSPALGSFLAGVVLAENEFRHELEVDIEPFKGLLMGLFFIAIGANIDFGLLLADPVMVLLGVVCLVVAKGAAVAALAAVFRLGFAQGVLLTVALAQGGEFAFVLLAAGEGYGVFDGTLVGTATLVVALSMLLTPLLLLIYEKRFSRCSQDAGVAPAAGEFDAGAEVIIAGYGRFGQVVGRLLNAQGYRLSILDYSPSQVELVRRFGSKVYYGDAAREDLLRAAGAARARMLVVAVDEQDKTLDIIKTAQAHFPHLQIFARAIDRRHAYELMHLGVRNFRRETFDSALNLGIDALTVLAGDRVAAERAGRLFGAHDLQTLEQLAAVWGDEASYGVALRQRLEDLSQVLQADQRVRADGASSTAAERARLTPGA